MTGALELALSRSFLIASDRARFADTHTKIGLFPGWGQSALLASAIGVRRAREPPHGPHAQFCKHARAVLEADRDLAEWARNMKASSLG